MAGPEQDISVEQMDDEEEEQMDQTMHSHASTRTPVIVSVQGSVDSDSSSSTHSPAPSPSFQVPVDINTQRMLANRLQVRQTLSEPGLKAKVHRQKEKHRLSPIMRRHELLGKTLSMGAALDTTSASVLWKPVEMLSSQRSPTSIEMHHEGGEESPGSTDSHTLTGASITTARLPLLGGLPSTMPWLASQGLTQEQLESMYKQIPATQEQLEAMQKQMLALFEQQRKLMAAGTATGTEMFQFPLAFWAVTGQNPAQIQLPTTTTSSNSTTPSPTPSNSSTDSGISANSGILTEPLSLDPQRRPLSASISAPSFQTHQADPQYDPMLRQYQVQHQHLLLQQQQLYQHYLEQQQRLIQQAMIERKQFEDQQRQLTAIHLRQQQELQKKQQLLRQMQEQQFLQLQRQQQMILLQSTAMQQQQQHQLAQAQIKPGLRRTSGLSPKDTIVLPYSNKQGLTATSSNSSTGTLEGSMVTGSSPSELNVLSVDHLHGGNRSPSLTPKASLTPTNSLDSTASTNGRTSPNISVASPSSGQEPPQQQGGTGLVYDSMMLKHSCNCGGSHPEHPGRLQSIWARLHETRVVLNCRRLRARKASLAELQAMHSENHVRLYGRPSQRKPGQDKKDSCRAFIQLPCGGMGVDQDTYWNETHTSNAARMAVGSVIELADKVVSGEVKNGFAFVRPPGHHALPNQAMAFCYFNNVALAAKAMVSKSKRVMVVDWDIHHGNGTQQIFYDNPNALYLSLHRYDDGTFFPGTGRPEEVGSGAGLGFNVNIAFSGTQNFQGICMSSFGDAEYLAAFRSIVLPIAREFNPDIILVSAGFNATEGHPPTLGGYSVTPKCKNQPLRLWSPHAHADECWYGKVAMALEGGYELMSLCAAAEACMRALIGSELPQLDASAVEKHPQPAAIASMEKTLAFQKLYWRSLSRSAPLLHFTHAEAKKREMEEADTVSALASLSVAGDMQQRIASMQTAV